VEIWIDGSIQHKVPPRSPEVDHSYDVIEGTRGAFTDLGVPPVPSGDAFAQRLAELRKEIADSAGAKANREWQGLARAGAVNARNTRELVTLLRAMETQPEISLELVQNVRPPVVAEEMHAQLDQRLHNFVASAGMLIDHTRRLFDGYAGSNLAAEYEQRKDRLIANPVVSFIKGLRNYLLHHSLPVHSVTVSMPTLDANTARGQIQIPTAVLLQSDFWDANAKEYLATCGDGVLLSAAVEEYTLLIGGLYDWVFLQYQGLHQGDIHEYNEMILEYNWTLSCGRQGQPRSPRAISPPPPAT
jgi:hypothetical protein